MHDVPYLSVVIPAYNEATRIGRTLTEIHAYLEKQAFTWEVLVVLDGVTDNTAQVVADFASEKANIRWIDRPQNRGKGYTVREGLLAATGQIRLFTDADNSTDMRHFDAMIPLFETGHAVVIASRDGKDAEGAQQAVPQSFLKRSLGNLGNLVVQFLTVPGIWDTQCGFKAFTAEAAQSIFPLTTIDGWLFDPEALAIARLQGYKIGIIGAHWIDAEGTHVKSADYFKTILEALRIRWNLLRKVYQ
ncbi:MAG TPA: glycosyltransferase family 2 protein [Anaerolineae bacterium]|nr:glycosyltransferase family 2 protein [Anaerolineae bacterium]